MGRQTSRSCRAVTASRPSPTRPAVWVSESPVERWFESRQLPEVPRGKGRYAKREGTDGENLKQLACLLVLAASLASGCAQTRARVAPREPIPVAPSEPIAGGWRPTTFLAVSDTTLLASDTTEPATDDLELSSLESFESLALSANPTIALQQARVDAAEGRRLQVGLRPNPVGSLSVQEIGNENSAGQYGAFLGQKYVRADKLQLNRNAAGWEVKRAEEQLAAQRLRVLTDVRRAFYSTLVAQQRVKVARELYEIARQAVLKARELIKNQQPRTILTQAEIEVELAALLFENSRTGQEAVWRRLATLVGQPSLPRQEVMGDLDADVPQLAWKQALERLRRESPELAAVAADVERTRWALHRANAEGTPNVTLQAGAYYDDASSDPFATVQLSMPIQAYDWNQGGIAEAEADAIAARKSVERVELSLSHRLANVFRRYEQARQQASRYSDTILGKAKQNLDLNRQSYESGESSYLAVLTAQRSYSQARLASLNALEQLWSATVEIQGLLLSGSLE